MAALNQILSKLERNDGGYFGFIGGVQIEIVPSPGGWESIVRTEGISFVAEGRSPEEALALTLEEMA